MRFSSGSSRPLSLALCAWLFLIATARVMPTAPRPPPSAATAFPGRSLRPSMAYARSGVALSAILAPFAPHAGARGVGSGLVFSPKLDG
jgi:hypothetical protein